MRKGLFWLNDKQWARIEPHLPTNQTGPARDDDRRIISGIVHMLQCGARWRDCPPDYGPYTTIYNRVGAHGDAFELLELAEEVFDEMPPFVHLLVDGERLCAPRMLGDDYLGAAR